MPFAKRELPPWTIHAAAAVALGLLLGFAGPFGSGTAFDRPVRYAFWLGLTLFGYGCVIAAGAALSSSARLARLPQSLLVPLSALVSAVPQALACAWTFSFLQPGRNFSPAQLASLFVAVAAVQLAIALIAYSIGSRTQSEPVRAAPPPTEPRFLQRLPARLGRDLVALEAENHYLRVHTSTGSELVLARLADAVAQLANHDGLQVHRGWWVAADSVTGVETRAGRTFLRLKNGLSAPVSRTHLQAVRARAWPPA